MDRFKDPKFWAPLVGSVAIFAGWYGGYEVPAEAKEVAVNAVTTLAENVEAVVASALGAFAAWKGLLSRS